jgi:hypothetical protein
VSKSKNINCRKVVKKVVKKLSKSCQKVAKKLPKLPKLSRIGCEKKIVDYVLFLNKVWGGWVGKKWFQGLRRLLCSQPKAKILQTYYNSSNGSINPPQRIVIRAVCSINPPPPIVIRF